MAKLTKIVATIGPSSESEEIITAMMRAGANVFRFNTKHNEPAWHSDKVELVKSIAKKINHPAAVLLDLQGPEIRIELPHKTNFAVSEGEMIQLTTDTALREGKIIGVPLEVLNSLQIGNTILFDDGASEFLLTDKTADGMTAQAKLDATVRHRTTMNTPGVVLSLPSLTERDYTFLREINLQNVDYVALSFVRDRSDIEKLRQHLVSAQSTAEIVAKIENHASLRNLDEIVAASDGIMVARGDLGVEVAYEELIYWQRIIIDKSRHAGKPVITATEMLKSMVEKPRPTRAEISDVAHAVYDGTDAIMLSDETAMGRYPIKCVEVQAKIAAFNEPHTIWMDLPSIDQDITGLIAEIKR